MEVNLNILDNLGILILMTITMMVSLNYLMVVAIQKNYQWKMAHSSYSGEGTPFTELRQQLAIELEYYQS